MCRMLRRRNGNTKTSWRLPRWNTLAWISVLINKKKYINISPKWVTLIVRAKLYIEKNGNRMHYSELIIIFYLKKHRLNNTGQSILKWVAMDEGFKKYRHLSKPHNKSSVMLTVDTLDLTIHTFLNLHIERVLLKAHYTG